MVGIYGAGEDEMPDAPLYARMTDHVPGISASIGFANFRGSNTLLRGGGYMDYFGEGRLRSRLATRRAKSHMIIKNGQMTERTESMFLRGGKGGRLGRRAERLAKDLEKSPVLKSGRLNNLTMRPRAFGRYHSLSVFGETGYSPFRAGEFMGKSKKMTSFLATQGIEAADGEKMFGRGLFSFASAGVKADRLEQRLAKKIHLGSPLTGNLDKRLAKVNRTLGTLGGAEMKDAVARGAQVGLRGDLLASTVRGRGSQFFSGYTRAALGYGDNVVGESAIKGVNLARKDMASALTKSLGREVGEAEVKAILGKGGLKTLGRDGLMKTLATKEGAKVLGARAALLAVPGLNVIATASLMYDLGKMGGEIIKSGINLAKDAGKSLKGDIAKPLFGMGYKDTEAAATSRARGVMAIQNSQLNARSALGNEGALMAAHFG